MGNKRLKGFPYQFSGIAVGETFQTPDSYAREVIYVKIPKPSGIEANALSLKKKGISRGNVAFIGEETPVKKVELAKMQEKK